MDRLNENSEDDRESKVIKSYNKKNGIKLARK